MLEEALSLPGCTSPWLTSELLVSASLCRSVASVVRGDEVHVHFTVEPSPGRGVVIDLRWAQYEEPRKVAHFTEARRARSERERVTNKTETEQIVGARSPSSQIIVHGR